MAAREPRPAGEGIGIIEGGLQADVQAMEQMLLRLSWASRRRLAHTLDAFHLTVPQYAALRALQRRPGGCTMSELAEAADQLSATMTGIVDRLVERQLVARSPDPSDRRSLRVTLTERGERLLDEIEAGNRSRLSAVLGSLSPHDRQQMLGLLQLYLDTVLAELSAGE